MAGDRTAAERTALVTGGGNGIGAAMCRRLAATGHRVVVVDLDPTAAAEVADAVGGSAFPADVSARADNQAMIAHAVERYGRLDVVVLGAGVSAPPDPAAPFDPDLYRRILGVNVDGVVFGVDAAVPALSVQGGAIVVTASLAALAPDDVNPLYILSKSAAIGYVRASAGTLAEHGITVNAVCPGLTDTAILGVGRRFLARQGFPLLSPDDVAAALAPVLDGGGTGQVWAVVAGRPPERYEFPAIPTTLRPDGTEARRKRFPKLRPV